MKKIGIGVVGLLLCLSCSERVVVDERVGNKPDIFPDYVDVTIPNGIAPLNFSLRDSANEIEVDITYADQNIKRRENGSNVSIPIKQWQKMLSAATNDSIQVVVRKKLDGRWMEYLPFYWYVAAEPIDPFIVYRLIPPGYTLWKEMGIYQRCLGDFNETAIYENKLSDNNCVNCHSFCMQDPAKMLFHSRQMHVGTLIVNGEKVEKLDTQLDNMVSSFVYPAWHPSGKYVAFSVNKTSQGFHLNRKNRIEVFDSASDLIVYDVEKQEAFTTGSITSDSSFETFPAFSPDGKKLYFCSADSVSMPESYSEVKYNLCSIDFDADKRRFGTVIDTLVNANALCKSVSFPRVSPDGKWLVYTLSDYGNFSIWHKESDLYLLDLSTGESFRMDALNSDETESYHSWSSNSHWIVFSSRRGDGLYTRPFICYIDDNGKPYKPFLLPQENLHLYEEQMESYNIPEFVKREVEVYPCQLGRIVKKEKLKKIKFGSEGAS